jgi:murein DD-endopeptidase MepM/ murein hydrolase activator NlpD
MHEIDASFRRKLSDAREKRQLQLRRRIFGAGAACVVLAVATASYFVFVNSRPQETPIAGDATEPEPAEPKDRPFVANAIIDLAGDPLIIRLGSSAERNSKLKDFDVPDEMKQPAVPDSLQVLSDTMLSSSVRIMALPSSPEDFAFFQAQSARANRPPPGMAPTTDTTAPAPEEENYEGSDEVLVPVSGQDDLEGDAASAAPAEEDTVPPEGINIPSLEAGDTGVIGEDSTDMGAGWGETVGHGQEALPSFKETAIEDTTTVQAVTREIDRYPAIEDLTFSVKGERPLEASIAEYGFTAEDAKKVAETAKTQLGLTTLSDRYVVRLRGYRPDPKQAGYKLVQLSINAPDKYIGTIALADSGEYVVGADPWVGDDLSQYSQDSVAEPQAQNFRLLDAIYSTATRNDVPSAVTGEAIMLVSKVFDLSALATKDDKLTLVFAKSASDDQSNAGHVLYVAIRGGDRNFECFVYQPTPGAAYACMTEKDATHSLTVTNGMAAPVNGVLTSTFGYRKHPILGVVRLHKGVDWKAPVGTPIMAAFDGTIAYVGDGKGYGNVIRIDHGGGRATAYAHMSRFEPTMRKGLAVHAGEVIGYVGTTGLSTGPHLHFELYQDNVPIDPLGGSATALSEGTSDEDYAPADGSAGVAPPVKTADNTPSDSAAVEKLVNRIVHVESGGSARAKNPKSSATGLGQFIKSTWIRMMKSYHPELFRSLSTEDLLALRFDPTISREMVANLARENEARLRQYGHSITAGRLYLAHFLGVEGAHQVLAAAGEASIAALMGESVITANPFLTGKNCAFVVAWAEKKMSGKAVTYSGVASVETTTVVKTSPEFIRYRETIQKIVEIVTAPA